MSPLTTEGLIEEMRRFRSEKLALVALLGCMGQDDVGDALVRLRDVRDLASDQLVTLRRKRKADWTPEDRTQKPLWEGVYELANEAEPWLAQVASRVQNGQASTK